MTDVQRAVRAVQIGSQIHVLHAFQKKAKNGTKTPQHEVDLIKRHYQRAVEIEKKAKP